MKILWSSGAVKDLNKIYEYYVHKNQRAAAILYNGILDKTELLRKHPYIAPVDLNLDDFPQTFRSLPVSKSRYKVLYYVKDETIYVSAVWNCKRNPEKLNTHLKKSMRHK